LAEEFYGLPQEERVELSTILSDPKRRLNDITATKAIGKDMLEWAEAFYNLPSQERAELYTILSDPTHGFNYFNATKAIANARQNALNHLCDNDHKDPS
jgi:hypothetical protein